MKEKEILDAAREKLGIDELNRMQTEMLRVSAEKNNLILLAPTGSGKTLAFALPLLKRMNAPTGRVQAVVIAPTRELVLQIAEVLRRLATGFKVTPLYGGHSAEDEKNSLSVVPDIVVATPGRLVDHVRRGNIDLWPVRLLIVDEFDKLLELGFEEEMRKICNKLKNVSRRTLTSATELIDIPAFLGFTDAGKIDCTDGVSDVKGRMNINKVYSEGKDKLESLLGLLKSLSADEERKGRAIVFVNYRESAERTAAFLKKNNVDCALYHGALDQRERETALAMFGNGSRPILVSTDLASRGLDIAGVESVIHYHLPLTVESWTHRNGRTARQDARGSVYVLLAPDEQTPEYMRFDADFVIDPDANPSMTSVKATLCIGGGKKDKLSRKDILGFLTQQGGLPGNEVGKIDLFDHYSLVAIPAKGARQLAAELSRLKIKGERRKVTLAGE